jgi:drug/metabolite transporter (DMT)-like permease
MSKTSSSVLSARRRSAVLSNGICVLLWGFSFISIKEAVPVFPPMILGALRFAIAMILLLFMYRLSPASPEERRGLGRCLRRDLPLLAGSGLSGVTLYFFCENNGVALVTASEASIIVAAIPVLAMSVDWAAEKCFPGSTGAEIRLGRRHWLGALVSISGVSLVAGVSFSLSGSMAGYFYMAGAALSWVIYGFLTRPLFARGRSRIYIVFWQNLAGLVGFLPFAALEIPRMGIPSGPVLGHVLFLGLCCSALGYWLYAYSLEILGVTVSSVFINVVPVVTAAAGFFILNERLSPLQWGGAALVIAGVYLTTLRVRRGAPKAG